MPMSLPGMSHKKSSSLHFLFQNPICHSKCESAFAIVMQKEVHSLLLCFRTFPNSLLVHIYILGISSYVHGQNILCPFPATYNCFQFQKIALMQKIWNLLDTSSKSVLVPYYISITHYSSHNLIYAGLIKLLNRFLEYLSKVTYRVLAL